MNQPDLEDWSLRAMQTLQDFCDEAQEAAGDPDDEGELRDVRAVMADYERIAQGLPAWQSILAIEAPDQDTLLADL